jgi:hypothetical protein
MTFSKDPPPEVKPQKDKAKTGSELDRVPSAGAIRVRNGLSVSEKDIVEAAKYGGRERESSSDSD